MESWITFWTVVCIIGAGAFYLLVVAIIPLGFRDLLEMFRRLGAEKKEDR